ncbi:MAG: iron chelate uptake ABC transporter family permease subunit, partial [Limnochordales bacterium]
GPASGPGAAAGRRPAASAMAPLALLLGLAGLLAASVTAATAVGTVQLPYGVTARVIAAKALGLVGAVDPTYEAIVWSVRLPRVLAAGVVGLALAVSGAAMQGIFKNPLASPDIIGVSSGGAVGAVIGIFLGWPQVNPWLVPGAAFAGGLVALLLVYALATRAGRTDLATLLLAGVAVSSLAGALIALLYHFVDDGVLRQIVYWLMGNLGGKTWEHLAVMTPMVAVGSFGLWVFSRDLNLLLGGEDDARSLGVPVERTKRWVMVLTALATGAAVSVAGVIGFVGLIVPHIMRLLIGPDHRWLIPASGLLGASFLILADLVARTAFSPVELRTGIVTALCGVPFFLYLLAKRRDMVRWS